MARCIGDGQKVDLWHLGWRQKYLRSFGSQSQPMNLRIVFDELTFLVTCSKSLPGCLHLCFSFISVLLRSHLSTGWPIVFRLMPIAARADGVHHSRATEYFQKRRNSGAKVGVHRSWLHIEHSIAEASIESSGSKTGKGMQIARSSCPSENMLCFDGRCSDEYRADIGSSAFNPAAWCQGRQK